MIIGLLLHQALLVREIGALKVGAVDLEKATVCVPATNKMEVRTLRLNAAQVMTLHAYLREDRARLLAEETDHLLLTSRGTPERVKGCITSSKPYGRWFQESG